ncbi:hypothetical protein B0A49_03660 [Cryomyces minteri]|uniref:Carboxylic ester hydrolase n=1 Tax=Cryomyces minteri TaxID=331657 RepID=A0A4U0XGV4_9PEZI|nr:hypothetical protein B0A49_03660 [Cryomyces minteri]
MATYLPGPKKRSFCNSSTSPNTSTSTAPVVDLGYVKYAGYSNSTIGINYYRGIPFAQAPVGDLRWRAPRPIEAKNNFGGQTINATQIAPFCYQSLPESLWAAATVNGASYFHPDVPSTEDCLILDVLVPQTPVNKSLPVIVQIHGGGYTLGSAQTSPGDALVHQSNGSLVYVAIQYRLGLFGFLAGEEVYNNGDANAGLLDQRAALDWVQRNIRAFGGDPSRVTIWGGSAGGGSVTYQLIAGGAFDQPPFSAAIPEYPWWQPLLNSSSQEQQYSNALLAANCTNLACLRSKDSATLQFVNQRAQNISYPGAPGAGYGSFYYGPVVDGKFIRRLPDQEFKLGNFYKVPLLVDHDAYEGYIFSNMSTSTQTAETMDAEVLFPYAGPSFFSRLYQLYPASAYNSTFFQRQTWFGDFIINCPTYYMATAFTDMAYNSSAVFKLVFAAGTQLHAATAPFLASNVIGYPGANNQTLAQIMSSYWLSFAITRDPNPLRAAGAPYWPSYMSGGNGTAASGESVGFNTLSVTYNSIVVEDDPDASAKCDFFSSQGYVVRN